MREAEEEERRILEGLGEGVGMTTTFLDPLGRAEEAALSVGSEDELAILEGDIFLGFFEERVRRKEKKSKMEEEAR